MISARNSKVSAGIDGGAATTKAVLLKDGHVVVHRIAPTGFDFGRAAEAVYREALSSAGIRREEVGAIAATGYGRHSIRIAGRAVSEITAQAKGVGFLFPEARGIVDIGGQDSKVIVVEGGKVIDFQMNDRCAAGTGKFLEHTAEALEVGVADLGRLALAAKRPAAISSMCTVFAGSEVISLRAQGIPREDIAAGLVDSIVKRIVTMARPMGLKEHVALVGGVAKNPAIRAALEKALNAPLFVPPEPQITAALGAALIAQE